MNSLEPMDKRCFWIRVIYIQRFVLFINTNIVMEQMPLRRLEILMSCLVTMWRTSKLCANGLRGFDRTD